MTAEESRAAFERWCTSPPREWHIRRYPEPKPGHLRFVEYRDLTVQCAWDAWQEASKTAWNTRGEVWSDRLEEIAMALSGDQSETNTYNPGTIEYAIYELRKNQK